MKLTRTINHAAQYTALVDILFATIGVFVIVFALQDLAQPQDLQPAPYDHLILCDGTGTLTYHGPDPAAAPLPLDARAQPSAALKARLEAGGRILVSLAAPCLQQAKGESLASRLHRLEEDLSERESTETPPLTLFEFAPLAADPEAAGDLLQRFRAGAGA